MMLGIFKHEFRAQYKMFIYYFLFMAVVTAVCCFSGSSELVNFLTSYVLVIMAYVLPSAYGYVYLKIAMYSGGLMQNTDVQVSAPPYLFYSLPQKNSCYIGATFLMFSVFQIASYLIGTGCFAVLAAIKGTSPDSDFFAGFIRGFDEGYTDGAAGTALQTIEPLKMAMMIFFICMVIILPYAVFGVTIWCDGVCQKYYSNKRMIVSLLMTILIGLMTLIEWLVIAVISAIIFYATGISSSFPETEGVFFVMFGSALLTLIINTVAFTASGMKKFNKNLNLE
jgi:hypothetical protein